MLESLGYHVLLAATREEALAIFTIDHCSIDLVLLDVIMPAMGGPAALERMLATKPGLPAVFTTGYTAEADSVRSMAQRGVLILQKPYGSKELAHTVRALLNEAG